MTNHLGNVLSVVSDRKLEQNNAWVADVQSYSDYYPFGMTMPNRHGGTESCRYQAINGMERDDEMSGLNNHLITPLRPYNPRLARWITTDPVTHPQYSPYSAFDNNPIYWADPSGADSEKNGGGDPPKEGDTKKTKTESSNMSTEWDYTFEDGDWVGKGGKGSISEVEIVYNRPVEGYTAQSDNTNLNNSVNMNLSVGSGALEDPRAFSWLYSLNNATGTNDGIADYSRSMSNPNYQQNYGFYLTSKDGEGKPNSAKNVLGSGNIDDVQGMAKDLGGIVKNEPINFGKGLKQPLKVGQHLVNSQKKANKIQSEFDNYKPIFSKTTSDDIQVKTRDTILKVFVIEDTLETGGIIGTDVTDTISIDSAKKLKKFWGGQSYR